MAQITIDVADDVICNLFFTIAEDREAQNWLWIQWPRDITFHNFADKMKGGATITCKEVDGAEVLATYTVTWAMLVEAVQKLQKYPHILANVLRDDADANDAEVWLQLAMFDEVRYG